VEGLCNGTIDLDEHDKAEMEKERLDKIKEEMKIREKREFELKGRPGKGLVG